MDEANNNAIQALNEVNDPMVREFAEKLSDGVPFIYEISPELADHIRTCCGGRNRHLSFPHVNRLSLAMKNGEWMYNNASIGFFADGKLSDGQHRLAACIEADNPFKTLVVPGMDVEAILTVDQQNKSRTPADYLEMVGFNDAKRKSFIATNFMKFRTSGNFNGSTPSNTAIEKFVNNNDKLLEKYLLEAETVMEEATNKAYNVNSAALWLFVADKDAPHYKAEARQVLMEIITGSADKDNSPGLAASRVLTAMAERKKAETINMNKRIGTTVKALNFTITGKSVSLKGIKYPSKKGEAFPSMIG